MSDLAPYLCPNCRTALDGQTLTCRQGHEFERRGEVLVLLEEGFAARLEPFLEKFSQFRGQEDKRLLNEALYPQLPCAPALAQMFEWRWRCHDVSVITDLLADRPAQRILDIGAWNGWLSNQLAARGHQVTAADFFIDPYDGLQAKRLYPHQWEAVQMDLQDLSLFARPFDVVIVNHCLQFFADPPAYVAEARRVLRPGGVLILAGLSFFRSATAKAEEVAAFRRRMRELEIGEFKPMKGYLDWEDRRRLRAAGVSLKPYPQLRLANLKAGVRWSAPWYAYGVYRQK